MKINVTIKGIEVSVKVDENECSTMNNLYSKIEEISINEECTSEEFIEYIKGINEYFQEMIGGVQNGFNI